MKKITIKKLSASSVAAMLILGASAPSSAQTTSPFSSTPINISLPSQPLSQSVKALSVSSGLQIIAPPNLLQGHQAASLSGRFTPQQAMDKLLHGSGLTASFNSDGITIHATKTQKDTQDSNTKSLSTINVVANSLSNRAEKKIFQTPGPVSYRGPDLIGNGTENILRSMPGAFTLHETGSPSIRTNIRGLQGFGRVQTIVDGVTQAGMQANPGHGQATSSGYVDDNFIVGIDMQRGASAAPGALAGSVEYTTLRIKDVVVNDKNWGIITKYLKGTNGYGANGMLGVAGRTPLAQTGWTAGVVAAYSGRRTYNFKNSEGIGLTEPGTSGISGLDEPGASWRYSNLYKVELTDGRTHAIDAALIKMNSDYESNVTRYKLKADTRFLKYHYTPRSSLVNLKLNINDTDLQQVNPKTGTLFRSQGQGFNFENTSLFDLSDLQIANKNVPLIIDLKFAGKYQRNTYSMNKPSDEDGNLFEFPTARQVLSSLTTEAGFNIDRLDLTLGAHLNQYHNYGKMPPCVSESISKCFPNNTGNYSYDNKEHSFDPYFKIGYKVNNWFQPFFNISRTSRSPNPAEFVFPSPLTTVGKLNPYLKKETSINRDIGFNVTAEKLLSDNDELNLKFNYFNNKINNYITTNKYPVCKVGNSINYCPPYYNFDNQLEIIGLYVNYTDPSYIRGWEIEGSYTWNQYFANLTLSKSKTFLPLGSLIESNVGDVNQLPSTLFRLDLGRHFMDKKIMAGIRANYESSSHKYGESIFEDDNITNYGTSVQTDKNPVIFDIYGNYQISKHGHVFLSVQNIFNKNHTTSMSRDSQNLVVLDDKGGTGRGRTFKIGVNYRF